MAKFIVSIFTFALIISLAGALYLTIGAYNMSVMDRYTCAYESDDSATCKTYLALEAHTSN